MVYFLAVFRKETAIIGWSRCAIDSIIAEIGDCVVTKHCQEAFFVDNVFITNPSECTVECSKSCLGPRYEEEMVARCPHLGAAEKAIGIPALFAACKALGDDDRSRSI